MGPVQYVTKEEHNRKDHTQRDLHSVLEDPVDREGAGLAVGKHDL